MARKRKATTDALVVQNAAKTLLANIRFASVDAPVKSIVVTSSAPNEGKTTIAYNLARAMASGGNRTLLVECDMRRRSLASEIGARGRYGLYAVLSGQVGLSSAVVGTKHANLLFLDAEPHIPNPADILSSKRFRKLMATLEAEFDFVVFDTPPVGTFVDAAIIASLADAAALVVRERYTKRDELVSAYDQLKKADANVIGVVMNMCEAESSEYYYAYYNRDGKRVREHEAHVPNIPHQRGGAAGIDSPAAPAPAPTAAEPKQAAGNAASPTETAQFTAAAAQRAAAAVQMNPVNTHRRPQ